jgi:hypothetical protein
LTVDRQSILIPPQLGRIVASVLAGAVLLPLATVLADAGVMEHLAGLPFVAAVVVCTVLGRFLLGVLSAISATILLDYYVIAPTGRLDLESPSDYVSVGIFALVSVGTASLVSHVERLHATQKRANARLSFIASSLQQRLLPNEIPHVPPFEIGIGYWPVGEGIDVGGDFYDVFQPREGQLAVVVGDVSGKGPEAAGFVGGVRHIVRTLSGLYDDPADVLHRLNASLLDEMSDGRYCTICIAVFDSNTDGAAFVRFACAGHPPPILIREEGPSTIEAKGTLLGVLEDVTFEQSTAQLIPGDSVVMYTDGLYERPLGRSGRDRDVPSILRGARDLRAFEVVARIADELDISSGVYLDDTALIVVRDASVERIMHAMQHGDGT